MLDSRLQPWAEAFVRAASDGLGVDVRIISAWRSVAHNAAVGGAPRSRHLQGLAFDLRVAGLPRDQVPPQVWLWLGEGWESVGGRWGGRFARPDVNHFDVG